MSETCRHCGHSIEPHSADYTHGWRHLGGSVWCKRSMAQPMEDEPAVPSDPYPDAEGLAALRENAVPSDHTATTEDAAVQGAWEHYPDRDDVRQSIGNDPERSALRLAYFRGLTAGLLATARPDTTEAQAQALEAFAQHLRDTYPEDVFPPIPQAAHKTITDSINWTGWTRDSVSADVMRRAAAQADAHAAAIREGADQ